MSMPFRRALLGTLLGLTTALVALPGTAALQIPPPVAGLQEDDRHLLTLTLTDALALAEGYNPQLQLARYQLTSARSSLTAGPANAAALAPAASMFAQAQYGLTIPESAISAQATGRQAQISFEQASAQYEQARQQIQLGVVHRYAEWQRTAALVTTQQQALERAETQEAHLTLAVEIGSAARYELLQAQAQSAGQQAALTGATVMAENARYTLEAMLGVSLDPVAVPEALSIRSDEISLDLSIAELTARAMYNRPDLRQTMLDLSARRLQTSLATGGTSALQLQVAATQYQHALNTTRAEVQEAVLTAQGALAELEAREAALAPVTEALRLAHLRYDAGLATYLEVQGASGAVLQAEAARIQAAANLTLSVARIWLATGDL